MLRSHAALTRIALMAILALLATFVVAAPVSAGVPQSGDVTVNKTDAMTGDPIEGACFEIWEDDPEATEPAYGEQCTDEAGTTVFDDVEPGDYVLVETVTPPGYAPVEPIEFTVNGDQTLPVENDPTTVTINKTDAETGEPLEGACFFVTNEDQERGDFTSDEQCTDENGQTIFAYLEFGDYRVYETRPPDGYAFHEEPFPVTVSEDDPHPVLNIENFPAPPGEGLLEVNKLACAGADEPSMAVYENPDPFAGEPPAPDGVHPCAIGHAVFEVTGGDLAAPMRLETNVFGWTLAPLSEGTYQIREVEPNAVGPIQFTVDCDEQRMDHHACDFILAVAINPLEAGETLGPTPTPRTTGGLPNTADSEFPGRTIAIVMLGVVGAGVAGMTALNLASRRRG